MHVVTQIRYDKRDGGQSALVLRETGEGQVTGARQVTEVDRGVVRADVAERKIAAAPFISGRWHTFGIARETQLRADQLSTKIRRFLEVLGATVAGKAMRRSGKQRQVVRLARMRDRE